MELERKKGNREIKAILLYLAVTVIVLAAVPLILDPPVHEHYMDKSDMFEIVKNNRQAILEDVEKKDYTRTLGLLDSSREEPSVDFAGDCVTFYCYGHGFASNTSYEGFYYTPWDGPARLGGIDVSSLKQDGNEWVWYEKDMDPSGDNEYHTEKICDNFWYYRLVY